MDINKIAFLTRIQTLEVIPFRNSLSAAIKIPKTTGKAVKRTITLRSIDFLTAHKRSEVQPLISDPPIPVTRRICKSELNSGLPIKMPNICGNSNPTAQSASVPRPSRYATLIKNIRLDSCIILTFRVFTFTL